MKIVLLTGATGFLGSGVARALIQDGYRVIAIKRRSSSLHRLGGLLDKLVFYDVEEIDVNKIFTENGQVNAVIHTATCYGRSGESASNILETNVTWPLQLLESAQHYGVKLFINTDTSSHSRIDTSSYLNAYSLSKKQFSLWGEHVVKNRKIIFLNIRVEQLYGPSDDRNKFTSWVIESCLKNQPKIKLTAGQQRRDFIYIDDAIYAFTMLMRQSTELDNGYHQIGLGTGNSVTVRYFIELSHKLSKSTSELCFGALPYREHEYMESYADTKMLNHLGWKAKTSLDHGINKTLESLWLKITH